MTTSSTKDIDGRIECASLLSFGFEIIEISLLYFAQVPMATKPKALLAKSPASPPLAIVYFSSKVATTPISAASPIAQAQTPECSHHRFVTDHSSGAVSTASLGNMGISGAAFLL